MNTNRHTPSHTASFTQALSTIACLMSRVPTDAISRSVLLEARLQL